MPTAGQGVRLVPILDYMQTPAARAGDLFLIQRDARLLILPHTGKAAFLWLDDLADRSIQLTHSGAHAYTGDAMCMFRLPSELAA